MSASDDLKALMRDMEAAFPVRESTLKEFLHTLDGVTEAQAVDRLRAFLEFAIRIYLIKSSSFNMTRADQLLNSLGLVTLGHTRAD